MKLTERQVVLIKQAILQSISECENELLKSVITEHRDYWLDKKQELCYCIDSLTEKELIKKAESKK